MEFADILEQTIALLQHQGRISYGALKRRFGLDDAYLLIEAQQLARDENGRILVWAGPSAAGPTSVPEAARRPTPAVSQGDLAHGEHRTPDAERRQLTVLFCDLVDSTALAGQLDPEDLREVLRAYQAACATVIERLGGYIAQYLGDGLLVYFGYPQAHEDDALQAARAGLGMVAAMADLNTRLARRHGVQVAVRIGIHTGLVVVGEVGGGSRQEQLALGDTPNLAARLQGLAAPDTLVLSAATFRLVQGYFTYQDLGAHTLRGVAVPVQVYRILGESGAQSRLEAMVPSRLTPLVGREEDVALIHQRWEQAKAGLGQVVLLSGEAGIGKSRLVQVLKDHAAHEPHASIEWRGSAYHQQSALYPVIMQLHRLLRWRKDETPEAKLHSLETTLTSSGLTLPEVLPLLVALLSVPLPAHYPPLTLTPQRRRQKTLEALLSWLSAEAQRQPVLLIVEDLHWIDPSTLELLSLLIDQVARVRLCLVLTARSEFRPPWAMVAHLTHLTLRRFTPAQVMRLATHVADDKALPPAVLEEVVRKTDGVPLFVEELTKVVLESGLLQEREDGYALSGPLLPLAIPVTLHDALMARLDRLAAAKQVAQLGAAIGRTFAYDLVQAVGLLDEATLPGALTQLVEAELVAQRGMPPQATYTFKHALIQDAAYQSLLRSTRQQYHQRIAQVLEVQFLEMAEMQPELLAHHYTEASLAAQAVSYWHRAGQQAVWRSAHREAIAHLARGIEVLQAVPDTPARAQRELALHMALCAPLQAVQGFAAPEVARVYTRARELCQQEGETVQFFQILWGLYAFHHTRAEWQTAWELGEQLLLLANRLQDPACFLETHRTLGGASFFLGKFAVARTHMEQGLALYNPQQHRSHTFLYGQNPKGQCLAIVALSQWVCGYPDQARQYSDDLLAFTQDLASPHDRTYALDIAATLHQFRGEIQNVQARAEAAIALATEHGFALWRAYATILRGWTLAIQGQAAEAGAYIHQGITAWQATGAAWWRPYFLALLAEAYGKAHQTEEALDVLAEALATVQKTGEHMYEAELYRLKGELLLEQESTRHKVEEAAQHFAQALAIARRQQAKSWELRAATSLARLWQGQSQHAEARELLAPVYGWFTEGFDTADLHEARALLVALG